MKKAQILTKIQLFYCVLATAMAQEIKVMEGKKNFHRLIVVSFNFLFKIAMARALTQMEGNLKKLFN